MKALLFALALVVPQTDVPDGAAPSAPPVAESPSAATAETPATGEPATVAEPEPAPATEPTPVAQAKPEELPFPVGAPTDDYGLVSWCYGALSGYLELHDRVLPEVTRIEGAYRRPGTRLEDDMATYDDMQKISRENIKLFARAMEAAERASIQPINVRGAAALQQGRKSWTGAAGLPDRTVAQQWMGWSLPVRCTPTATSLEARAKLLGTAFKGAETDETEVQSDTKPTEQTPAEPTVSEAATPDVEPLPINMPKPE